LKQALKTHLGWHGARLSFLALFLLALLKVKTVNLKELSLGFEGRALVDSHKTSCKSVLTVKMENKFNLENPPRPSKI
jgi:hypothetical protein